jgi:hypothetical protein
MLNYLKLKIDENFEAFISLELQSLEKTKRYVVDVVDWEESNGMIEELSYDHAVVVILAVLENVRDEFSYGCADCEFRREFLIEESVQPIP